MSRQAAWPVDSCSFVPNAMFTPHTLWGFLKPLAQLLEVATPRQSLIQTATLGVCSQDKVVGLTASHCLIDGSDSQRTLLPNDSGYPRCWPEERPRHGEGARRDPGGSTYSIILPIMSPEMFKKQKVLPETVKPIPALKEHSGQLRE